MKKSKILIAEDNSHVASIIQMQLEEQGYVVPGIATSGNDAIDKAIEIKPDLLLMDIKLKGLMDGITTAEKIQAKTDIPIIYLTAYADGDLLKRAKVTTPYGYLLKPYNVQELYTTIEMALYHHNAKIKAFSPGKISESIPIKSKEPQKTSKLTEKESSIITERLKRIIDDTVDAFSSTIEFRDPHTSGHQKRTTHLAYEIAQEMQLSEEKLLGIKMAGTLHDIGKIQVPSEILSKPSKLSEFEFGILRQHCQVGYDILKHIDFPWPVAEIVLQHHERQNGSGYPQGLTEKDILLEAAVLAVADVVEAMSSHRPYRPSLGIETALKEITQNSGILYHPEVVDACIRLFRDKGFKLEEIISWPIDNR